jgi:hypothetical protein
VAESARWVDHQGVPPDPGCYEERYRLTDGAIAAVLVAALINAELARSGGVVVYAAARRAVAFRADYEGITLGALPGKLTRRRRAAVFVPWADVYYQHAAGVCRGGLIGWERVGSARPHLSAVVASTLRSGRSRR